MAEQSRNADEQSPRKTGRVTGGERISLQTAIERTKLFREYYMQQKTDMPEVIKANLFSKESILQVLSQPGCEGIRIYHSINPHGIDPVTQQPGHVRELILAGVDKNSSDLLTTDDYPENGGKNNRGCNLLGAFIALPASTRRDAVLIAAPHPCPNLCGSSNGLQ